ncbi:MAG: acyltransferase [Clostridia bacterium]|nr:acyltransferase [Clostridia bacterium]
MQAILDSLRRYRNEIKGFAILWVVFFHAKLGLSGFLADVQQIGYCGVDIFFFLSGFGLYHSLERSSDISSYLKRRAARLLPAYLPFCLVWLVVMIPLSKMGMASAIRTVTGNLFMVGFFSGAPVNINWYVSGLMLSLVLAPVFFAFLGKENCCPKRVLLLIGFLFMMGTAFIDTDAYMAISRLPVFVLGMVAAGWKQPQLCKKTLVFGLTNAFVIGFAALYIAFSLLPDLLVPYALYWHPFVLITPPLCVSLAWLFGKCPGWIVKPLSYAGAASFEIFLFNAWIELLGKRYGLCHNPADWLLWSAASVAAGLLYHLVVEKAVRIFSKKS